MNQEFCAGRTGPLDTAARLASGYGELTRLDDALRAAQQRLAAAHLHRPQQQDALRAEELYREILALRARSRRLLAELAELWACDR